MIWLQGQHNEQASHHQQANREGGAAFGGKVAGYPLMQGESLAHFLLLLRLGTPALCSAIAMACFLDLPARRSVLILAAITRRDRPRLSGIASPLVSGPLQTTR